MSETTKSFGAELRSRFGPSALTPGQRFTTGVVFVLTSAVLLFGLPDEPLRPFAAPVGTGGARVDTAVSDVETATEPAPPVLPSSFPSAGESPGVAPPAGNPVAQPAETPGSLAVIAVVRTGDTVPPGRGDADMARFFLSRAGLDVEYVSLAEQGTDCASLASKRAVLVMSDGLAPPLRQCLLDAGTTMLAHDARGPARTGSGAVLATRRGLTHSIAGLARSTGNEQLQGKVGIAASADLAEDVRAAVPQLAAAGVSVVATTFIEPGPTASATIADGVLAQHAAGVETVLFALPVSQQSDWAAKHRGLRPELRIAVLDAHDAVTNEGYLPAMDGAIALTSYRTPWYERTHGETPEQKACRQAWESSVSPNQVLSQGELVRALVWCQHASMLTAAATAPGDALTSLRTGRFASPVTSTIGPLGGDLVGPLEDALVVWRSDCRCWTQRRAFAPRPAER